MSLLLALYIFWFLHQTTTLHTGEDKQYRCISFDSYIKPQHIRLHLDTVRSCISFDSYIKPQLWGLSAYFWNVVYLLIPTSNHNYWENMPCYALLYIFWFLHQTTTNHPPVPAIRKLYIFWFLHQTTTYNSINKYSLCCISFDSYIKPQLAMIVPSGWRGCISFDSYIKPQLAPVGRGGGRCCISFDSYIKPQHKVYIDISENVVYLLIPTSNHNYSGIIPRIRLLYIFWFLHQTTTQ